MPIMPDQTSPSSSQRTVRRSSADQSDSGGFSGADSGLMLASDARRSPTGGNSDAGMGTSTGQSQGLGLGMSMGAGGGMPAAGMDGVEGLLRRGNLDDPRGGWKSPGRDRSVIERL